MTDKKSSGEGKKSGPPARVARGALSLGPLASTVGSTLNVAAPALDGLISQLTGVLGVRLGVAEVRVDKIRCGVPTLVS